MAWFLMAGMLLLFNSWATSQDLSVKSDLAQIFSTPVFYTSQESAVQTAGSKRLFSLDGLPLFHPPFGYDPNNRLGEDSVYADSISACRKCVVTKLGELTERETWIVPCGGDHFIVKFKK
jgi:hypothetical protein